MDNVEAKMKGMKVNSKTKKGKKNKETENSNCVRKLEVRFCFGEVSESMDELIVNIVSK